MLTNLFSVSQKTKRSTIFHTKTMDITELVTHIVLYTVNYYIETMNYYIQTMNKREKCIVSFQRSNDRRVTLQMIYSYIQFHCPIKMIKFRSMCFLINIVSVTSIYNPVKMFRVKIMSFYVNFRWTRQELQNVKLIWDMFYCLAFNYKKTNSLISNVAHIQVKICNFIM